MGSITWSVSVAVPAVIKSEVPVDWGVGDTSGSYDSEDTSMAADGWVEPGVESVVVLIEACMVAVVVPLLPSVDVDPVNVSFGSSLEFECVFAAAMWTKDTTGQSLISMLIPEWMLGMVSD